MTPTPRGEDEERPEIDLSAAAEEAPETSVAKEQDVTGTDDAGGTVPQDDAQ